MTPHDHGAGLALWLMSDGDIHRRLTDRIVALSRRFDTPSFEPHVTLLAGIHLEGEPARAQAAELAAFLRPLRLQLVSASQAADYFRAVVLEVDPSPALLEARRRAIESFGLAPAAPFRPHLSLLYGDLGEEERRQAVASLEEHALPFPVSRLELVETAGPVGRWKRLAAFALSAP